jgi:hypothetical protein
MKAFLGLKMILDKFMVLRSLTGISNKNIKEEKGMDLEKKGLEVPFGQVMHSK